MQNKHGSEIKLSIVIPCYERDRYLNQTLLCALESKSSEVEVIVLDNNSQNRNIEHIASSFPTVRYIKNSENLGLFGNWNKAFRVSKGEFVFILGDDDLIERDFVSSFLYYLSKYPSIDLYYSNFSFIDSSGNDLGHSTFPCPWGLVTKSEAIDFSLSKGFGIPTISMVYRKSLFSRSGFDEKNMGSNDWAYLYGDMPWKLAYGDPNKLVKYRKDGSGASIISSRICNISQLSIYYKLSSQKGPLLDSFFSSASNSYWRLRINNGLSENKYILQYLAVKNTSFTYRFCHATAFCFFVSLFKNAIKKTISLIK
ncbi:glycosyltransferase [Vibrio cholerae]|uniref:glycosyltransferase family 2 protein n=1 Tax=Vibrio cholerae TaxID=666 RepID=UPI002047C867|nr:glycosyltransferase family 2 protein [Vibrio cholerae]MCU4202732.1 glycosyltransferase [Vibrio cholerae]MCU4204663.1 glycosyltransferase [Vibrio cholerae]BCN18452.1 putative glycosyltransferase [Vibrio cholerae]GHX80290.1 glycosyl transferase family 2 [Vibrio cholerae]